MNEKSDATPNQLLIMLLFVLALLRLFSLGLYPLADTTEARYAEIARLMVTSGDWITPQIDLGVPFWGKPPLSIWLSALSFKAFGVNEFASRFPSFLLGLSVVGLVYAFARKQRGTNYALATATVLSTSAVFFISSGAVMTDPSLLLGTTLSMVSFYLAMNDNDNSQKLWGFTFFIGMAISLLAKGPVGLVLTMVPVGGWVVLHHRWKDCWQQLPWIKGLLLTFALSLPWYLLAEKQTPGFLEYFLIGEHWKRFVESGWSGDLYGSAHSRPLGTIWYYWLASALPWSLIPIVTMFCTKCRRQALLDLKFAPKLSSYLLLWTLTPMLFFTFAGNILWTYVLPGIPAFAMLIALFWSRPEAIKNATLPNRPIIFSRIAIGMFVLLAAALLITSSNLVPPRKCQEELIATYERLRHPSDRLVYFFKRPHSAQFYSRGTAIELKSPEDVVPILQDEQKDFFVVKKRRLSTLPNHISMRLENLGEHNNYYLLREHAERQAGL